MTNIMYARATLTGVAVVTVQALARIASATAPSCAIADRCQPIGYRAIAAHSRMAAEGWRRLHCGGAIRARPRRGLFRYRAPRRERRSIAPTWDVAETRPSAVFRRSSSMDWMNWPPAGLTSPVVEG
jgi:hypothetical protein